MNQKLKKIEAVINARLKLQSTQKSLMDKFDLYLPTINYVRFFGNEFDKLEKQHQKDFAIILGGKANLKHTLEYLNSLKNEGVNV